MDLCSSSLASPTELDRLIAAQGSAKRPLAAAYRRGSGITGPLRLDEESPEQRQAEVERDLAVDNDVRNEEGEDDGRRERRDRASRQACRS